MRAPVSWQRTSGVCLDLSPTEDSRSSCSGSPLTAACPAPSERTPSRAGPAPSLNAKFRSTLRPSSGSSCSPSPPPGNSLPDGWFRPMWRDRRPAPVEKADRSIAVDIYQLRAGHPERIGGVPPWDRPSTFA